MQIERQQFDRWQMEHHPEFINDTYLEWEQVSTGLSTENISYGYIPTEKKGTRSVYVWIPKKEAKKFLKLLEDLRG